MREVSRVLSNVLLYSLFSLFLVTLQTSLWYLWLGPFPPPYLWIPPIVFLALYRPPLKAIFTIYVVSIAISSMSSISPGLLMLNHLLIFTILLTLKSRIFWIGKSYFVIATTLACFSFVPIHWILSLIVESNPIPYPRVLPWFVGVLLTPLFSTLMYNVFNWLDRITKADQVQEIGTDIF